nr:hypothetical protein CFP56_72213 [Quercus suber]
MVLGLRRMASKWICVLRSHNVAGLGLGLDRTAWIGLFGSDYADGTGFGTGSDCVDRSVCYGFLYFFGGSRKLGDEKAEVSFPNPSIHVTPRSPTPYLEVTAAIPPVTRARGESKIGMSVWDDPATALGRAHNVITSDELKILSSIPSHELVSRHIHKLVQVLGESLHITTDYLNVEEKVVVATSKAESVEAECS